MGVNPIVVFFIIIMKTKEFTATRNRNFVKEYLKEHHCVDCGNSNILVLDFDHVRGEKITNISKMVSNGSSLRTLLREIEKCEIRCSNCHRIVTYLRRNQQTTIEGIDYFEY